MATNQIDRYKARRAANTMSDGSCPYGWWKRYQRQISQAKTISDAEIRRDAARQAKLLDDPTEESR